MSSEHFKGRYEVELKYRLTSKYQFLETLKCMPHEVMLEDNTESDSYFDTPDKTLQRQNKSLCIRTMEPSGIKLWIVKGPEADRCEATNINDADNALSMLQTMGYGIVQKISKTRSIYFLGQFHVTVDSLARIGDFAEFAIMTDDDSRLSDYRSELEQLASEFGLSESDLETRSYKEIFAAQCA
ncbi:class IV adenylate cyclase [Vibrio cholerae]|uniref:class IV adenylate cyclase n=1 Tax=Vibrio cholerae TaxID=666 RepID=UPI0011DC2ADB|nr:class IV adenylate cyclase [Vibrio cholerae]EGR0366731.1 class IV adenylate cyclase [Vibrio cholerae]EIA0769856.1 class IV adenylate cyclase [Vibrio cholerae]EID0160678.1 class IV adenylate cyclase [Vibrio cholerae]EJL6350364.1 class IV adenylate cyclase [Vibrio cholerae]TXY89134.1 class IV adenylate cyclase [Vibrio cholerae]